MSTSKLDTSNAFHPVTLVGAQAKLTLPAGTVKIRRNGIEFLTGTAIPQWTEMTVQLRAPGEARSVNCTGVVVACTGNRHSGYLVSMVFINLTRTAQERLHTLAFAGMN
jgi:hypothetical protein